MQTELIITADQDIGMCIRGPFAPGPDFVGADEEDRDWVRATHCHRGLFWIGPEDAPVIHLELGYRGEPGMAPRMSYVAPLGDGYAELLQRMIEHADPEDLLATRLGDLFEYWERCLEEERVPVGELVLWSQVAGGDA